MIKIETAARQSARIWALAEGPTSHLDRLSFSNSKIQFLPSAFDLTGFAAASVGIANLAAAELLAARRGVSVIPKVEVNVLEACAAFKSEALMRPMGWKQAALWDPLAGDYKASDGWVRLHTNYKTHRDAALKVLNAEQTNRSDIETHIAKWSATQLESEVVAQGGCAAALYGREGWLKTTAGASSQNELPLFFEKNGVERANFRLISPDEKPLAGIRVLDLTRVIAGPECTRFLASRGADVLRLDPPGFEEVTSLLPDTTVGKRCAALDLKSPTGRQTFESLVKQAHVLVTGLRGGVIDHLGLSLELVRQWNPSIIVAQLNAYGWNSEWTGRRGFDSLVQMSTGIAALGAQQKQLQKPTPLPAQALDHGAGYLLSAGVCRALTLLLQQQCVLNVKSSLVGVANFLFAGPPGNIHADPLTDKDFEACLFTDKTVWGAVRRVMPPGLIDGKRGAWEIPAGPLCRDEPLWHQDSPYPSKVPRTLMGE